MKDDVEIDFAQVRRAHALMAEAIYILDGLDFRVAAAHADMAMNALIKARNQNRQSRSPSEFPVP